MTDTTRPFFAERKRIVELAVKYRLPDIYFQNEEFVDDGGLMAYGTDYPDLYRRTAGYAGESGHQITFGFSIGGEDP